MLKGVKLAARGQHVLRGEAPGRVRNHRVVALPLRVEAATCLVVLVTRPGGRLVRHSPQAPPLPGRLREEGAADHLQFEDRLDALEDGEH